MYGHSETPESLSHQHREALRKGVYFKHLSQHREQSSAKERKHACMTPDPLAPFNPAE